MKSPEPDRSTSTPSSRQSQSHQASSICSSSYPVGDSSPPTPPPPPLPRCPVVWERQVWKEFQQTLDTFSIIHIFSRQKNFLSRFQILASPLTALQALKTVQERKTQNLKEITKDFITRTLQCQETIALQIFLVESGKVKV